MIGLTIVFAASLMPSVQQPSVKTAAEFLQACGTDQVSSYCQGLMLGGYRIAFPDDEPGVDEALSNVTLDAKPGHVSTERSTKRIVSRFKALIHANSPVAGTSYLPLLVVAIRSIWSDDRWWLEGNNQ